MSDAFKGTDFEGMLGKQIMVVYQNGRTHKGWVAEAQNDDRPLALPRSNSSKGIFFNMEGIASIKVLKEKRSSVYDSAALDFRIATAARIILSGGPGERNSRTFDTCFEMGDGDQVVRALVKRSTKNDRLRDALPRFINNDSLQKYGYLF